jgi:hypothetical protein
MVPDVVAGWPSPFSASTLYAVADSLSGMSVTSVNAVPAPTTAPANASSATSQPIRVARRHRYMTLARAFTTMPSEENVQTLQGFGTGPGRVVNRRR